MSLDQPATIEKVALAAARSTYAATSLLNPAFAYVPSNKTDVAETFKRVRERMGISLITGCLKVGKVAESG